ncbi:MAG TPA: NUDIX hydrolase [Acidimicrobiales bacterium]|nr:NUDIX hydrolase [Acidimicrobiales bacterium]
MSDAGTIETLLASVEPWTVRPGSRVAFSHELLPSIVEEEVVTPDGTRLAWLRWADARDGEGARDGVIGICLLDHKVLVAAQWCVAPGRAVLEFPGGALHDGEPFEDGVARECREEVGIAAGQWSYAGRFLIDNRRSSGEIGVFVGTGCKHVGASPEAGEAISVALVTLEELDRAVRRGLLESSTALSAWLLARDLVASLL